MVFTCIIEEVISRSVEIEAATREEALRILEDKYRDEEIVLTADDYTGTEFRIAD